MRTQPAAYQDVRSDKSDTNWLLLDYEVRLSSMSPPAPTINSQRITLTATRIYTLHATLICSRDTQSDRSDKLKLTATGSGGLPELRDQLDDSKASYAYARVQYANDKESKREKFILVVWIGPNCKVMRKAKVRVISPHPSLPSR